MIFGLFIRIDLTKFDSGSVCEVLVPIAIFPSQEQKYVKSSVASRFESNVKTKSPKATFPLIRVIPSNNGTDLDREMHVFDKCNVCLKYFIGVRFWRRFCLSDLTPIFWNKYQSIIRCPESVVWALLEWHAIFLLLSSPMLLSVKNHKEFSAKDHLVYSCTGW